jgi:hypothetical protein
MSIDTLRVLRPMAVEVLAQLGLPETEVSLAALSQFIVRAIPVVRAEEEKANQCRAIIKSGDKKGSVCGKALKNGVCPLHKEVREPEPETLCDVVLKSGEKKGQTCGKKCATGETRCATHAKLDTPGNGCVHVAAKGNKQGEMCDRKCAPDSAYCSHHQVRGEKRKEVSDSEPSKRARTESPSPEPASASAPAAAPAPVPSAPAPAPVEFPQIRCIRRAGQVVVKNTCVAIDQNVFEIIGHVVEKDGVFEFIAAYHESMPEVAQMYQLTCKFQPARMIVSDE